MDIDTLRTLGAKEIREGLAEVIKYGVISDESLFTYLEDNLEKIFSYDSEALTHIVKRGCEIKADVVERDEKESNLRKILNFGHTLGHAVENLSDYTISHGQAISIGMVWEGALACAMGTWKEEELKRLTTLLSKGGTEYSNARRDEHKRYYRYDEARQKVKSGAHRDGAARIYRRDVCMRRRLWT